MSTNKLLGNFKKLFSILKGQNVIWKLISFWKPPKMQIVAFICFLFLFKPIMGTYTQTALLIVSMWLHEQGHGIVLAYGQIKYQTLLLFPLGAVAAPVDKEENKKSDELPANVLAWLMHAGILGNIVLMGLGTVLTLVNNDLVSRLGSELIYVNMMLAAFNILPVWTLDAGQLFHIIFSSLQDKTEDNKNEDRSIMWQLIIMATILLGAILASPRWQQSLLNVFHNIGWVAFLLVFIFGVVRKAAKDDVNYPKTGRAMSKWEIRLHLLIYFVMVVAIFGIPTLNL